MHTFMYDCGQTTVCVDMPVYMRSEALGAGSRLTPYLSQGLYHLLLCTH